MKFFFKNNNFIEFKKINFSELSKNNLFLINSQKNYFNEFIKFFFKNGFKKKIKLQLLKSFNFFFFFLTVIIQNITTFKKI